MEVGELVFGTVGSSYMEEFQHTFALYICHSVCRFELGLLRLRANFALIASFCSVFLHYLI